ncbi:MAG: 4Fe-4S dicluster domain-containing protein [Desulfobulbaceae bacterium]|nr:4Fe-4S dicluster domain-containing protein [Desulfobulbaceae bacterium]
MAIPTSRTKVTAEIRIDENTCTGCGLCVSVCKDFGLEIVNDKARVNNHPVFGCIGCGHCMAICPSGAIEISGRTLSPDDLFDLPDKENAATYEELLTLLQRRRSIREFKATPVDNDLIKKILDAALTAPMGLPPSDVNVIVLESKDKVRVFAEDFCSYLENMKWLVSDWFLLLMRPFWGKANDQMFRNFIKPLVYKFTESMRDGVDLVTYDAPLAMYFYGSPYADPADPIVAATYAMVAAETLGLGTCMIGSVHPFIQKGKRAKEFRKKQGIKFASQEGLMVIFGYPQVKYDKGIRRTFASVE